MSLVLTALASAGLCAALIVSLKPWLIRYALARPNARSSHRTPTPQGGGIAVLAAALTAAGVTIVGGAPATVLIGYMPVALAAVFLAVIGAVDDIRPLPALPRLIAQCLAVSAVVISASALTGRILPDPVPHSVEVALVILAGVWFVNLVNFMDGLDWITVAEFVPITAALVLLFWLGAVPFEVAVAASALLGALLAFAPFNKPVARLFLGDVGSLPIGLLVGWMLFRVAETGAFAAALLLPLYYLADATITLLRRLGRREKIWEAHRSHFYQRATDNGFSVLAVSGTVFALNIALAALAIGSMLWPSVSTQIVTLLTGLALVGVVLRRFSRRNKEHSA